MHRNLIAFLYSGRTGCTAVPLLVCILTGQKAPDTGERTGREKDQNKKGKKSNKKRDTDSIFCPCLFLSPAFGKMVVLALQTSVS